jgi:putative ABC transport system permease protein
MNDLRFAFRQLLKNPGFTAVVVLTLALGIGAGTAIYSVANRVLLNPVPGREADRLMQVAQQTKLRQAYKSYIGVNPPVLRALRDSQDFFADLAWCDNIHLPRKTEEFVQDVMGTAVSPNYFTLLGVKPVLGRTFAPDELTPLDEHRKPIADSVIVISDSLWKSLLGGDPGVIGRIIELGDVHFTIIGVMPSHFKFPWGRTEFWIATEDPRVLPNVGGGPNFQILARLKPDVDEQQARVMLDTLSQRVVEDYSQHRMYGRDVREAGWSLQIRPLRRLLLDQKLEKTLFGLVGAIGFVLLIVCANIANLMLARTENRQQELAVRAALGAGRFRLLRQMLTESLLLALMGGVAGLITAWWGIKLLVGLIPDALPRLQTIQIDGHALAIALLISIGTGLLFGLAPALHSSRTPLANAIKQAGTGATAGAGWRRYRGALVVVEVALAVVLLAGAGLMIQSVVRLLHVNPGFDPENLLRVTVRLPWAQYAYPHRERRNVVLAQIHERLAALPGVKAVGLDKKNFSEEFKFASHPAPITVETDGCSVGVDDLFRAMRVPLLAGRYLEPNEIVDGYFMAKDSVEGTTAVIINQTLARLCWPGSDALGQQFVSASPRSKRRYEVVGIVADTRDFAFDQRVLPTLFRPYQEFDLAGQSPAFMMRTATDPGSLIPAILKELKAVEPAMITPNIRVTLQVLYESTQAQRTFMLYLVALAALGLLLAALGIYGVLAYSVARRTREFGIRMAVGANRRQVLTMVMAEGGRLVGIGMAAGLIAAFCLTRLIRHQLFDVSPTEPLVFLAVSLLLLTVAALACLLPARRGTRINPMEALRYE